MKMAPSKIACVGAGLIGSGWATLFAINGKDVWLHDSSEDALENSQARIRLESLHGAGRLKEVPNSVMVRIGYDRCAGGSSQR